MTISAREARARGTGCGNETGQRRTAALTPMIAVTISTAESQRSRSAIRLPGTPTL